MASSTYIKSPLNYTGGKYKLLPQIMPLFAQLGEINTFVDLFAGGANVAANVKANRVIANDYDAHVINIFKAFQNNKIEDILAHINERINEYSLTMENQEGYNAFRDFYNNGERLPLDLFVLICFSFNHQIRFNQKDEYNMPFGKNRSKFNKTIETNLIKFVAAIKDIIFTNKDFRDIKTDKLHENDLVYCDPPYLITCATYNEKDGWNEDCERDLLRLLDTMNANNVKFALSNVLESKGKTNEILMTWANENGYVINHLNYSYSNCNYHTKDKSSTTDEVLICNF